MSADCKRADNRAPSAVYEGQFDSVAPVRTLRLGVTRIKRRRATTLDQLRDRLRAVMTVETEFRFECATCHGTGQVVNTRKLSGTDVAKMSGLALSSIYGFLGGKSLLFEAGMRLLAWIEEQEAPPPAADLLAELDEDAPAKAIPSVELLANGNSQVRAVAIKAGITAALDNRNRPVQFK